MNFLGVVKLVAGRELGERLRGRALWIGSGLGVVVVIVVLVLPGLLTGTKATQIGLVGPRAQSLRTSPVRTGTGYGLEITTSVQADRKTAEAQIGGKNGLDAIIEDNGSGYRVVTQNGASTALDGAVSAAATSAHLVGTLQAAGVSPATITTAMVPPAITAATLSPSSADLAGQAVAALVAAFLLMYTLTGWGGIVAAGVAQEKTTRMAEVLVSAVPPRQLLVGKVLGIGVCGLIQVGIIVGAGAVTNLLVHAAQVPSTIWGLLPATILWFLLGYVGYSFVFAATGSMVARQEEVQVASLPLVLPLVAALLLAYAAAAAADTTWYSVLSVLPPFAPILMPVRIAFGVVPVWQFALGLVLMVASIAVVMSVTARIYSASPSARWCADRLACCAARVNEGRCLRAKEAFG